MYFYAFDSAELTDSSTLALDSLVTLMEDNPNITIELSSHCDYRGRMNTISASPNAGQNQW